MEKYTEITKEEYLLMKKYHRQFAFSKDEAMDIVNMNRKYVNPNTPSCMSCHSNLRTAKNELMTFYLAHQTYFEEKYANENAIVMEQISEEVSSLEKAEKEVKEYSKKTKKNAK